MPLLAGIFPSLSPGNREYADLGQALNNRVARQSGIQAVQSIAGNPV